MEKGLQGREKGRKGKEIDDVKKKEEVSGKRRRRRRKLQGRKGKGEKEVGRTGK